MISFLIAVFFAALLPIAIFLFIKLQSANKELKALKNTPAGPGVKEIEIQAGTSMAAVFSALEEALPDNSEHLSETGEDITRKKIEEELFRANKLESIGLLAGGIAHDFNNILAAITNNIQIAKLSDDRNTVLSKLSTVEKMAMRAKSLTEKLQCLSRKSPILKKKTSMPELIRESSGNAVKSSGITCEFSIPEGLYEADIDPGLIGQAINNLVVNASEAMPGGGSLKIIARNATFGDGDMPPLKAGRYISVSVEDQGPGISKDDMEKIFTPFFSTKKDGTGLGLTMTHAIVIKHDGHIAVESEPGGGATFSMYLPASEEVLPAGHSRLRSLSPGGGSRVLVMDDEADVRDSLGEILVILGYKVDFAEDGDKAVKLFKKAQKEGSPFAIAILDLTVPGGMGGVETIKKLREIDPDVRAIASSGYIDAKLTSGLAAYGFRGFLVKPYSLEDLNSMLNEIRM